MTVSAYQFKDVYDDLGVNIQGLGCIMLDVEPIDTTSIIADEDLYVAPEVPWINGRETESHVTVLYGLLPGIKKEHVDRVLEGVEMPQTVYSFYLDKFESTFPEHPYEVIVARVGLSPELEAMRARLSMLPHLNTHPVYQPHITLGYVRKGWYDDNFAAVKSWSGCDNTIGVVGLNYGSIIGGDSRQ